MAKCKLGELIDKVTPAERIALQKALIAIDAGSYVWSAKNLSRAIGKTQYSIGATTIKEHRNRMCGCVQ